MTIKEVVIKEGERAAFEKTLSNPAEILWVPHVLCDDCIGAMAYAAENGLYKHSFAIRFKDTSGCKPTYREAELETKTMELKKNYLRLRDRDHKGEFANCPGCRSRISIAHIENSKNICPVCGSVLKASKEERAEMQAYADWRAALTLLKKERNKRRNAEIKWLIRVNWDNDVSYADARIA